MNVEFDNKGQYIKPLLSLYYRDKQFCVGILSGVYNITLSAKLNALSEMTFNMSTKIFDNISGLMIDNPMCDKIKKNMLIYSTGTDNIFNIPVEWNSNGIVVTKKKFIGIHWWVITNVEENNDENGDIYTITLTSYDSTLRERKMFLSSGTDDNKQVLKLCNKYVITYRVPDLSGGAISIWTYNPTKPKFLDKNISSQINISQYDNERTEYFVSADEVIKWFLGENTGEVTKDGEAVFSGGVLSKSLINDYIDTSSTKSNILIEEITNFLSYGIRWKDETDADDIKIYFNGDSMVTADAYANIPDDTQYHLSLDVWETLQDKVESAQNIWRFGYISPTLKTLYRTIEDGSNSIYEWLLTIEKKFNCFHICDCDNNTINFYTQKDLFKTLGKSIYLTYDNLLKNTTVNTSDREPITCSHIYSDNQGDYSIAYVNPLGNNLIYNFGDYQLYMDSSIQANLTKWYSRITDFESVFKRLGFLRFYYTQTINYWYSKMSEYLDSFFEIADTINLYAQSGGITDMSVEGVSGITTKYISTSYGVGSKIPVWKPMIAEWQDRTIADIGLTKDELNNCNKYFSILNLDGSRITTSDANTVLTNLRNKTLNYYIARWSYIAVKNRYTAVKALAQFIYSLCRMDKTLKLSDITSLTTQDLRQSKGLGQATKIKIFNQSVTSITQFLTYMMNDDYVKLFNSQFLQNTSSGADAKGFLPSLKNSFDSKVKQKIKDNDSYHYYDSSLFSASQLRTLGYYTIEGSYSDEYTIFKDLDFDDSTIDNRHISTKQIIDDLSKLYQKAKSDMVDLSKQSYDFSLSTANMLMSSQLALQNGENVYKDLIYIGATINAEIKPNQWETPTILEMEINYDSPNDITFNCSNNYRQKPLAYRFEELYNDISQSNSLSLDYSSDWFENN